MKEPENWLRDFIIERLENEGSVVALFVGRTGSSKSGSAISLAYAMDPTFNLDRIVFNIDEFFRVSTEENLKPGSFIIFDDAGVGAAARDWQDQKNKALGGILQTFRYKQLPTIITTPDLSFIDKQVRLSIELQFVATDVRGMFKPFVLYDSPKMDGKKWHQYPSVNGEQVKLWPFPPPPEEFFEQYKIKKDQAFQGMLKKFMNEIRQEEELKKAMLETKEQMLRAKNELLQMRLERERERAESMARQETAREERARYAAEREAIKAAREKMKIGQQQEMLEKQKERQQEIEKKKLDSAARKAQWVKLREAGMSTIEIAKEAGVSDAYVSMVLKGRR